jgi:hypothetical protein
MLAGIGLVVTQIWDWWWFLFKASIGLTPTPISYVMWMIPGVFLFIYSYRRFKFFRAQHAAGLIVRPPAPSPAMKVLGKVLWTSGHVVMLLSILGTVAMLVSAHIAPSTGVSGVPLGMGLMLGTVLYVLGSAFKNG